MVFEIPAHHITFILQLIISPVSRGVLVLLVGETEDDVHHKVSRLTRLFALQRQEIRSLNPINRKLKRTTRLRPKPTVLQ